MIVIGADVHKRTHTFVAVDAVGKQLGSTVVPATTIGHRKAMQWAHTRFGTTVLWAIEDCRNMSAWLERDLLGAAQKVVRVAPRLMAEHRRTGRERGKSDPIDALAVARAAAREPDLPVASHDALSYDVKALVDYRDSLVRERTSKINRVLWRVHQLDPERHIAKGGLTMKKHQEALQVWLKTQGTSVDARLAGKEITAIYELTVEIAEVAKEITTLVSAAVPTLLAMPGCGVLSAAKLLGESADITRFPGEAQFARHAGIAPVPVWSANPGRHRLTRSGNRQINAAIHRIALTQARMPDTLGYAYYEKKQADGKSPREAMRCLKRRLARVVYNNLTTDHHARTHEAENPTPAAA
ncbi:IS110 family transposase [Gordonia amicalis]|uniref:IS110 family transposase n=2 Tax=Gordonia amicalis TaxID=89053 RepID=UPI0002A633C1|nr:IS110 family transposase [Gordonia amicalis]MDV7176028.1 IS110 family transposase [Gordonia amicalis]NKX80212.1 IS110 family transposase [Gordonia amicalis]GAC55817.1 putative transposase [Gordonia amicalis NBRC 100051 = JCM 11271]